MADTKTKKNALQALKERERKEPTADELKRTIREQKRYIKLLEDELKKYEAK